MMMESMMKLPDDVFRQELLPFLIVRDIIKLVKACVNHKYRPTLMTNNTGLILIGDINIAPEEIDIHNPKVKKKTPGFSMEERCEFKKLLEVGFVDSFRHLYPDVVKYSYWSNFHNARGKNNGWRIDVALISDKDKICSADCLTDYFGSDHCPILLELK